MSTLTGCGVTLPARLLRLSQSTTASSALRARRRRGGSSAGQAQGPAGTRRAGGLYPPLGVDCRDRRERPGRYGRAGAGSAGVPGETVFLDLGHDHQAQTVTTLAATSTTIGPATGGLGGIAGYYMSSLQVQGLQPTITGLTVTMDLANNGTRPGDGGRHQPGRTDRPGPAQPLPDPAGRALRRLVRPGASTPITEATGLRCLAPTCPSSSSPTRLPTSTAPTRTAPGGWSSFGSASDIAHLDLKSWSLTRSRRPTRPR